MVNTRWSASRSHWALPPSTPRASRGRSDRFETTDGEALALDQLPDAPAGEEPQVGGVEDAPLVVVEHPEGRTEARIPVGDIGDAEDGCSFRGQQRPHLPHQGTRVDQVFEHVGGEHDIEPGAHLGRNPLVEISPVEGIGSVPHPGDLVQIDTGDMVAHGPEAFGQQSARTSQIEDPARWTGLEEGGDTPVRAVLAGLELVLLVEGDATPVAEAGLLHPVGHDILGDVGGIAHAVDIADLVAVVGGDGHLGDPHPRIVELDDDLGVEVEAVRVPLERELLEGGHRVGPVSGVEFGQLGAEGGVLESGQDPVPHILVERHPARRRRALDHDAGAEDGVGFSGQQRCHDVGQRLRRILPVPVQHDHDVEAVLDGQVVSGLLIAAVAQVFGLPDQGDREVRDLLVTQADQVRRVLAVVVADDDLFDVRPDLRRDAVEHLGQRRRRVIGDDENTDPLLCD